MIFCSKHRDHGIRPIRTTLYLVALAAILGALGTGWLTRSVPPAGFSAREEAAFPELVGLESVRVPPDEVGVFWAHGEQFGNGSWDADSCLDRLGYIDNGALNALKQRLPFLASPKRALKTGPEAVRFLVFENWYSDDRVQIVWGRLKLRGGGGWRRSIYVKEKGKWRLEACFGGRAINMWK